MKFKKILALLFSTVFLCGISFGVTSLNANKAFAGTTGDILVDDKTFEGDELDYGQWRYDRNAGIELRSMGKYYSFDATSAVTTGDQTGLKAKIPVPENSGTIVELVIDEIDFSKMNWLAISYGSQVAEQSNGAWNDLEVPTATGRKHWLRYTDGSLLKVAALDHFGNHGEAAAVVTNTAGDTAGWQWGAGEQLVIGTSAKMNDIIIREYYGKDGQYELSVRPVGTPAEQRTKALWTVSETENLLLPNPGGYIGIDFFSVKSHVQISDFRAFACNSPDAETTEENKIFGFAAEGDLLQDFNIARGAQAVNLNTSGTNSIAFTKLSDNGNPVLNRTWVYTSTKEETSAESILSGEFKLKINEIVGEKTFGAVFGVDSLGGDVGDDGTSYLYFTKEEDNYYYGLKSYAGAEERELLPKSVIGSDTDVKDLYISFEIYADGKLSVNMNEEEIYAGAAGDISAEGYFGFTQTGKNTSSSNYIDIEIFSMNLTNEYYARPATPETVTADFDEGNINLKEWYITSVQGTGKGIYVDDGALVFDGAARTSSITSQYSYSNFEFSFDVFDVMNTPKLDASGNPVEQASYWIGVGFGVGAESAMVAGWTFNDAWVSGTFFYFHADTDPVTGARKGPTTFNLRVGGTDIMLGQVVDSKYDVFGADFDPSTHVNILVRVVDGQLTIGLKLENEETHSIVYTHDYENGYTPLGHVSIFADGVLAALPYCANYKVDNIVLKNLDAKGSYIPKEDIGFTSNVPGFVGDYEYKDSWGDLEKEVPTGGSGCNSEIDGVQGAVILAVLAVVLIVKRRFAK